MLTFTIAAILLTTLAVAGWPLLALRRLRPALQLTGGSCCIAAGSTLVGLLAAGFIALPGATPLQASAQEKAPDTAASAEPVSESKPTELVAESPSVITPATPAPTPAAPTPPAQTAAVSSPAQSDIVLDAADIPPAKSEDLKIETLADGTIVIPAGRPEWVKIAQSDLTGPVHKIYVTSDPYKLPRDAQHGLDEAMKRATDDYIADQLNSPLAAKFIPYDVESIRDRFVKQTYHETVIFPEPVGPMKQLHALLEFDQGFRDELRHHWAGRIAESRIYQVGLGAGAALLLLASVFGYFRLDNATRGYYTGRLQFMTAAAILAIVALGAAAAFRFTWL